MRFALFFLLIPLIIGCKKESPPTTSKTSTVIAFRESEVSQLPGMTLWLKAESMALPDQSKVSEWKDEKSTRVFSQTDTEAQPRFVLHGTNGLPHVEFDGFNDSLFSNALKLSDLADKNQVTAFAVTKAKSVSTDSSNPWMNNPIFIDSKGQFGLTLSASAVLFFNYVNANSTVSNGLRLGKSFLVTAVLEGEKLLAKVGNNAYLEAQTQGISDLDTSLYIGGSPNGSDYLEGAIAEILFFKHIQSENRERVSEYLIQKYNLK